MGGRRTETLGEQAWGRGAQPRPATRASARVPGQRAGRRPSAETHRTPARRAAARERVPHSGARILTAAVLLVAGAVADESSGDGLGWIFALAAAAAALTAALACPRTRTWWAFAAPPLAIAVVAVAAQLLAGSSAHGRGSAMAVGVHWAIDSFPAMAAAEVAVLVVVTLRAVAGRGGRGGHA
ncbi:DUF6542 domain-containing protein [Streptomyces gamaensis]|uniref:DUF6542 domain-containing protein n=1 Tax=Streptomyces gamaensis TaxID=1763542 RepID=A0ABW0Z254_9ACTN